MKKYAITDIETTGGLYNRDKIIEIAIIVTDGYTILDQFESLINPERSIPYSITRITGINDDMVADAPKFYEVAKDIVEIMEGCIFIAHNVKFDYGFIKQEFKNLGYPFNKKRLCTVKLTRRHVPGLKSYGTPWKPISGTTLTTDFVNQICISIVIKILEFFMPRNLK